MAQNIQKLIAETFLEMAQGLESGSYGKRPKIALTGIDRKSTRLKSSHLA